MKRNKPLVKVRPGFSEPFEPRWFKARYALVENNYCLLEEWINPNDKQGHTIGRAVFDSSTGKELEGDEAEKAYASFNNKQKN